MKYFISKCALFLMILRYGYTKALSDAEAKAEFTKFVMTCTIDHPVPVEEIMKLQKFIVPTDKAAKCLLACAYRKNKFLSEDGLFSKDDAYKDSEKNNNGDEKRLANGKKLADICNKVNDVAVTDGKKGCDRAALIFGCITKNAPKLGFKV